MTARHRSALSTTFDTTSLCWVGLLTRRLTRCLTRRLTRCLTRRLTRCLTRGLTRCLTRRLTRCLTRRLTTRPIFNRPQPSSSRPSLLGLPSSLFVAVVEDAAEADNARLADRAPNRTDTTASAVCGSIAKAAVSGLGPVRCRGLREARTPPVDTMLDRASIQLTRSTAGMVV
jgi:hypothetical protein